MNGYLKGASVISQCTRCHSLRSPDDKYCPTCATLLGEPKNSKVRWLALNDISNDLIDTEAYGVISSTELQGKGVIN